MQIADKEYCKRLPEYFLGGWRLETLHNMVHAPYPTGTQNPIILYLFFPLVRLCCLWHCMEFYHISIAELRPLLQRISFAIPLRSEVGALPLILLEGYTYLNYCSDSYCLLSMTGF